MSKFSIVLLIVTSICLINEKGYCQTEKGNILVGGSIGVNSSKNEYDNYDQKSFSLNFNPNISYLIIDHLAIGIIIPLSYSKATFSGPYQQENKNTQYSFGPRIRYYFNFSNFALFPEISYTLGKTIIDGQFFDPNSGQSQD